MPRQLTQKERQTIISELRNAAMESMLQKGVKKTTVDELVNKVHIPKGTFYLFYDSKEMLLYDALMQKEEETHQMLSAALQKLTPPFSTDSLTELLYQFFQIGFQLGIFQLMVSGELDVMMRKLPDELVKEHISKDDDFLTVFRTLFPAMSMEQLQTYSAAFRAIFFTATYQREIGDEFQQALKILIRGLVIQMKEDSNDNHKES